MYSDVVDLRDFYTTALGQVARRMIRARIREIWPDLHGRRLVGLGYAAPYLRPFVGEAERVMAMMPAMQGVLPWPRDGRNVAALIDEAEIPLQDASVDRVLMVHSLECSEQVRLLLKEVWRVLDSGGRALIVVPNRAGIWARLDWTPFGMGHPYSPAQLARLLREEMFIPVTTTGALFMPPVRLRMGLGSSFAWERLGERWFAHFAGVILIEASKELYMRPAHKRKRSAAYLPVTQGALSGL